MEITYLETKFTSEDKLQNLMKKLKPIGIINKGWMKYRQRQIEENGQDAIASLIPDKIEVDHTLLVKTIGSLHRGYVHTVRDLIECDLDQLERRGGLSFGKVLLTYAKELQGIANAPQDKKATAVFE